MDEVEDDVPRPGGPSGDVPDDSTTRDRFEVPLFAVVAAFSAVLAAWWFVVGPAEYEQGAGTRSGTAAGVWWSLLTAASGGLALWRSRLPVRPEGRLPRRTRRGLPSPAEGQRTTLRWAALVVCLPLGAVMLALGVVEGWDVLGLRLPMPGYGFALWGVLVAGAGVAVFRRLRPRPRA